MQGGLTIVWCVLVLLPLKTRSGTGFTEERILFYGADGAATTLGLKLKPGRRDAFCGVGNA